MINWRGVGLTYIFMLAAALGVIATIPTLKSLGDLRDIELASVVAQIPASYVDNKGQMHPKHPTGEPLFLKNSKDQLVIVYNPYDAPQANQGAAMITLTSHGIILASPQGLISIPWMAIYGEGGGDFEPIPVSQLMSETFSAGFMSCWIAVTIWIFSSLAFVVLIASVVGKIISLLVYKVQIPYMIALRLSAVGSTLVGAVVVSQFFFVTPISYWLLSLIPVFYMVSFARDVRKIIDRAREDPEFALSAENPLNGWFKKQKQTNPDLWDSTYHNPFEPNGQAGSAQHDSFDVSKPQQNMDNTQNQEQSAQSAQSEQSANSEQPSATGHATNDQQPKNADAKQPAKKENNYAFNDDWDENEPIFDEKHEYHSGEVESGRNGKDSHFVP